MCKSVWIDESAKSILSHNAFNYLKRNVETGVWVWRWKIWYGRKYNFTQNILEKNRVISLNPMLQQTQIRYWTSTEYDITCHQVLLNWIWCNFFRRGEKDSNYKVSENSSFVLKLGARAFTFPRSMHYHWWKMVTNLGFRLDASNTRSTWAMHALTFPYARCYDWHKKLKALHNVRNSIRYEQYVYSPFGRLSPSENWLPSEWNPLWRITTPILMVVNFNSVIYDQSRPVDDIFNTN